jgi:hypothetical protein
MKKSDWSLIILVGIACVILFFTVVRENYDSTYPGGSMRLLQVNIDSNNVMTLIMRFGFEPPIDPGEIPLPIVYPTLSFVTVTDTNGTVYTLSASEPKSAPRSTPIDATFDVNLPPNVDRNNVQIVSATGYISFQTDDTDVNTPALSDSTSNIKTV